MATARDIIKKWFSNFKKPTQEQFWAWIDSFVHKDDKIPMQQVEGLETALQSVPTSDQFSNHLADEQAHKALFDSKIDKEDGKGLISDEERNQIQVNKNKRVVGQTITGDVNKVSTLILEDGSVIQAQFTDVAPAGPDVMLNSQNFDKDTGVLTGVRSDEQQITADLNGRWALLGHTHQIADVADLEDALNGKAEAGHTHAFSDLSGTEDIATKQEITDAVSGIKISSQNIYKGSLYLWGNDRLNSNNAEKGKIIVTGEHWNSYSWIKHTESNANFLSYDITNRSVSAGIFVKAPAGMKLVFELLVDYHNNGKTTEFIGNGKWQWLKIDNLKKLDESKGVLVGLYSLSENTVLGEVFYQDFTVVFGNKAPEGFSPNVEDLVSKSELEDVIDVTTIDNEGFFNPKSNKFRPYVTDSGEFAVFADKTVPLFRVNRADGAKSFNTFDAPFIRTDKLRLSVANSSWVHLDSRGNELNVSNPADEDDYKPIKASGFKTPTGTNNQILLADGGLESIDNFFTHKNNDYYNINSTQINNFISKKSGIYYIGYNNSHSELLLNFNIGRGSTSALQIMSHYSNDARLQVRKQIDNSRTSGGWRELAYYDDIPLKGQEVSYSDWTYPNNLTKNTIFLTDSGNKTIRLHLLENHKIVSFKKCYDGGNVNFVCQGKTIVMRGADAFNGKDGSNAVISIVGNKCYIDINNYE